jgi:8-oxo-dGTP pyrophosphatase MutT (NUDIX family)
MHVVWVILLIILTCVILGILLFAVYCVQDKTGGAQNTKDQNTKDQNTNDQNTKNKLKVESLSLGLVILNPAKTHVILVKSSNNYWGFPKGHWEPHETYVNTALRETEEEIGAKIDDKNLVVKDNVLITFETSSVMTITKNMLDTHLERAKQYNFTPNYGVEHLKPFNRVKRFYIAIEDLDVEKLTPQPGEILQIKKVTFDEAKKLMNGNDQSVVLDDIIFFLKAEI